MKKLAMLTATLALFGALSFGGAAQAAQTVDLGEGWSLNVCDGALYDDTHYAKITDEEAHSGKYSLNINYEDGSKVVEGTQNNIMYYEITHDAKSTRSIVRNGWDTPILVECYMKSDSEKFWSEDYGLYYTFLGAYTVKENTKNGTLVRLTHDKVEIGEPDADGWRKVRFTFTQPYGAGSESETNSTYLTQESNRSFKIQIFGHAENVYIDDIKMVRQENTISADYPHQVGTQMLGDGGFETDVFTNEALSDYGWNITANGGTNTAEMVEVDGNRMLKVTTGGNMYNTSANIVLTRNLTERIGGVNDKDHIIKFKMKGLYYPDGISADDSMGWENKKFSSDKVTITEAENGWYNVEIKASGYTRSNSQTTPFFQLKFTAGSQEIYLDDFSVEGYSSTEGEYTGKSTADYIYNGTHDSDKVKADLQADNWEVHVNSVSANIAGSLATKSTEYAYSGKNSMFIQHPGIWTSGTRVYFTQKLPEDFDYSVNHVLKFKMRNANTSKMMYVFYGSDTKESNEAYAAVTAKTQITPDNFNFEYLKDGWYECTVELPGSMAVTDATRIVFSAEGAQMDGTWIDDVSLTDEDGAEYIVNGDFEICPTYSVIISPYLNNGSDAIPAPAKGENYMTTVINNYEEGQNFKLWFALYKGGKLFDVISAEAVNAPVGEKSMSAMIKIEDDETYTAKGFLWSDDLIPCISNSTFPAAE